MAVFYNQEKNAYALISYKVLFSQFMHSPDWQFIDNWPHSKILASAVAKGGIKRTYHIVRHPEARLLSFFMDKFRQQPRLIHEPEFKWQACHELFFPFLNTPEKASNHVLAAAFLAMSFDQFMELLPHLYTLDVHLAPQFWTRRLLLGKSRPISWPFLKIIRQEDGFDALSQIPDIDFSKKTNPSAHLKRDFELTEINRKIIQALYRKDFMFGGYELPEPFIEIKKS